MPRFQEPHENTPPPGIHAAELRRKAHAADLARLERAIQRALFAYERLNDAEPAGLKVAGEEATTLAAAIERGLQDIAAPERMRRI